MNRTTRAAAAAAVMVTVVDGYTMRSWPIEKIYSGDIKIIGEFNKHSFVSQFT